MGDLVYFDRLDDLPVMRRAPEYRDRLAAEIERILQEGVDWAAETEGPLLRGDRGGAVPAQNEQTGRPAGVVLNFRPGGHRER